MKKRLDYFTNDGFGWYCNRCAAAAEMAPQTSRLMIEGEAETKNPELSEPAMAKWTDAAKTALRCGLCGTVERLAD